MVTIIGHRWSKHTHRIKDFLARNLVRYRWLDVETSGEAKRRLAELAPGQPLPVVLFDDGSCLSAPSNQDLAERVGLRTEAEAAFYDLIIVGGGPAGLAAGVYGASEGLRTLLVEREAPGGQAGTSSRIENYLGFPEGLSGADLAARAVAQADKFGVEILSAHAAKGVTVGDGYRCLRLSDGTEIDCHALLIATGVAYRRLDAPGVDRLTGSGVYYGAAMTEAPACRDEHVFIVGGANSAGQAALHFADYARDVTMLVREASLTETMSAYLIDAIEESGNIHVETNTEVVGVEGESRLETVTVRHNESSEEVTRPATTMYIFIGGQPHTNWLADVVRRDEQGFILTGRDLLVDNDPTPDWPLERLPYLLETSVPGVFAAGDVRHGSVKRVASAVGEGAIAVQFIHQYLAEL